MDIGLTITALRKARKISQLELAGKCKITQAYLSLIENNKKEPTLTTLSIIAEKLRVPLPVIFFFSLEKSDVPKEKAEMYDVLTPTVRKLVETIFTLEALSDNK